MILDVTHKLHSLEVFWILQLFESPYFGDGTHILLKNWGLNFLKYVTNDKIIYLLWKSMWKMKDPSLFIIESIFQSIQFRFLAISKIPEQNVSPWFVKMTSRSLILLSKISMSVNIWLLFWLLSGQQLQRNCKTQNTDFLMFLKVSRHLLILPIIYKIIY